MFSWSGMTSSPVWPQHRLDHLVLKDLQSRALFLVLLIAPSTPQSHSLKFTFSTTPSKHPVVHTVDYSSQKQKFESNVGSWNEWETTDTAAILIAMATQTWPMLSCPFSAFLMMLGANVPQVEKCICLNTFTHLNYNFAISDSTLVGRSLQKSWSAIQRSLLQETQCAANLIFKEAVAYRMNYKLEWC